MAKITEYERALSFDSNDVLLKDGSGGTKIIQIEDVVNYFNENLDDPKDKLPLLMRCLSEDHDISLWTYGQISVTSGKDFDNDERLRTGFLSDGIIRVYCPETYSIGLYFWDKNGYAGGWTGNGLTTSIGSTVYTQSHNLADIIESLPSANAPYRARVVLRSDPTRTMDILEADNVVLVSVTDTTLTRSGKPADSKSVGDNISPFSTVLGSGEIIDLKNINDYDGYGVTLTWNSDKTECVINGTYTGSDSLYFNLKMHEEGIKILPGQKYKLSCQTTDPDFVFPTICAYNENGKYAGQLRFTQNNNQIVEIPYKMTYGGVERNVARCRVCLRVSEGHELVNAVVSNISMKRVFDTNYYGPDDMIAPSNIKANKFFMLGSNLFLSTTAIASGDTLVPGTNCTALTLSDALNLLYTN